MAKKLLKTLNFGGVDDYYPAPLAEDVQVDANHRFTSDTEKTKWNAKAEVSAIPTKVSQLENDAKYLTAHQDISKKADLGEDGKVPVAQLPSYVDDVIEAANKDAFPSAGEAGKIYVDKETNKTYRWGGSAYVEISQSLALGETASTAYAGDKGAELAKNLESLNTKFNKLDMDFNVHDNDQVKHITPEERAAWNAKSDFSGSYNDLTDKPAGYTHPTYTPKASGLYKVTVDATGHVSATAAVAKSDITALGIPAQDTVYTHPETHAAAMITQDATHRFVSDAEKATWNGKAEVSDIPKAIKVVDDGAGNITLSL